MEPVLDAVADSSPAPEVIVEAPVIAPATQGKSDAFMAEVAKLPKGSKAQQHYRLTGDLKAAKAMLPQRSDADSDSSPDAEGEIPGNEPEAAPGTEQQRESERSERSRKDRERNDRRWKEITAENARLKAEIEQSRKPPAAAPAISKPVPVTETILSAEPEPPDMNNFTDAKEYHEANKKFFKDTKIWERQEAARTAAVDREQRTERETEERFRGDIAKAITKYKDFKAVVFNPQTPMSDAMAHLFPRMKDGAELAYYLGKNPGEAKRITDLTHINGLDPEKSVEHFAHLLKLNHPLAHEMLGMAKAELSRIKISGSAAAPAQKPLTEVLGQRPQSRPSAEVDIEANASVVNDPIRAALKRGDQRTYNRLMNEREMARKRGKSA